MATAIVWDSPAYATPASPVKKTTAGVLDSVVFGNTASESAHGLSATLSDVVTGGLGQSARVLNPTSPADWWGGTTTFTIAVNPHKTTYVTLKLWGGDVASTDDDSDDWRLQLFVNGEAVGWLDQGPVDNLDQLGIDPISPGRFYLHTLPLPESVTQGKKSLEVEIRSMGRIWAYGQADNFFYSQTTPSRGLYRAYSHDEPYFVPAKTDVFGAAPTITTRSNDDATVLATIRERVLNSQNNLLYGGGASTMDAWGFNALAEGYTWKDSPAHQNPDTLATVCNAIDGRYVAWKADDTVLTGSDQQWQGFGRVGLVLAYLWDDIQDELDKNISRGLTTLVNPGFEVGSATPVGWVAPGWANHGTLARDTSVAHSGDASMKITSDGGSIVVGPSGRTKVGAGEFTFSAWVKTDGTATTPKIDALFWDASDNLAGTDHNYYVTTGTTDWQLVTGTFQVPANAVEFEFWMVVEAGETAWFDDLTFTGPAPVDAAPVARRDAYTDMLLTSRDYWKANMRHYSNQAQITAIGIYQANRGLSLLSPSDAWPESRARKWIYESIGLKPWLGPELEDGSRTHPLGTDYYVVTPKGLTRELGYVGNYGEVTDWLVMMYESITRGHGAVSAPEVRKQMLMMITVRGYFRHFDVDADGNRVARLETEVGWRNEEYPGQIAYAQRTAWDSSPVMAPAVFDDKTLTGWAQEMIADGQFSPQLDLMLTDNSNRVSLNATRMIARDLPAFTAQAASSARLPGNWKAPDFAFTDETDGVIAIKNGQEIFYASTYWRARQAVNNWARVHLVSPTSQRTGTVREETDGDFSESRTFTIQDWITWDYAINNSGQPSGVPSGGWPYPGPTLHQAFAGEKMYLAPIAPGVNPALGSTDLGVEEVLVGRAPFYKLEYGRYIVGMNTTSDRTFTLRTDQKGRARLLTPPQHGHGGPSEINLATPIKVAPQSTVVLYVVSDNPGRGR